MIHEKVCKIHGKLVQENIISEINGCYKNGIRLLCRICRLDKKKVYNARKKLREQTREDKKVVSCKIHGNLNAEDICYSKSGKNLCLICNREKYKRTIALHEQKLANSKTPDIFRDQFLYNRL